MSQSRYPGLIVAMAGVGAAFIVAIGTGYKISGQRAPVEISSLYEGAIVVLVASIGIGIYALWPRVGVTFLQQKFAANYDLRSWEPERLKYNSSSDEVATCEHLQPIERAMRKAGIATRFEIPLRIRATCVINKELVAERFTLTESTRYLETTFGARSQYDPPHARFDCALCHSIIDVLSSQEARKDTPVFP